MAPRVRHADKRQTKAPIASRPERREHGMAKKRSDPDKFLDRLRGFKRHDDAEDRLQRRVNRAAGSLTSGIRVNMARWQWPAAHNLLVAAAVPFTTASNNGRLDVLLTQEGVDALQPLSLTPNGTGKSPWPAKLERNGARAEFTRAKGPDPTDPLEAAFRRYAAEAHARSAGSEP